jgi:transposase
MGKNLTPNTHDGEVENKSLLSPKGSNNYPQDWPAYNEAQMREKLMFLDILGELCSYIPAEDKVRGAGRPRAPLSEMVFSCVQKVYEQLSSRRVNSDLEIARKMGYLEHTPHFNTVLKYFNDPQLVPILTNLIQLSALPLKDFETTFAVDASGLSKVFYSRWLDHRFGYRGDKKVKIHDWLKIHLICGVKSNIVTHIVVTDGYCQESPVFPELVQETAKNFKIKEVCADKGYSGRENMQVVLDIGAFPYILFRSNSTGRARGNMAWRKLFLYFQKHKEEFMRHYHKRSNAESTFSMLKRKFQGKLMLKNEIGQANEALAKILCHNITVLVHEAFEGHARIRFQELAHLFPALHINPATNLEKI